MALIKRGNTWYTKFRISGKQILKSLGTSDRSEAVLNEAKLKKKLILGHMNEQAGKLTLSEAISKAEAERFQHNRDGQRTVTMLNRVLELCGNVELSTIDKQKVNAIKSSLVSTGISLATVNRYLAGLKTVLNLAYSEWEAIDKVPVIKLYRESKGRTRILSDSEELALNQWFHSNNPVIADVMTGLIETGMRLSECLGLKVPDINQVERTITLHADSTKSGKSRTLPISERLWPVIEARRYSKAAGTLFPVSKFYVCDWFSKARKALNMPGVSAHVCRHTFASRMLGRGQSIQVVQKWLGHASIQMTVDRYGHLDITSLKESLI